MCANSPAKPKMIATAAPESVAWLHCGGPHTIQQLSAYHLIVPRSFATLLTAFCGSVLHFGNVFAVACKLS